MRVQDHVPSEAVRRKAEAAGINLEALKRDDPTAYAMLNAARLLHTEPELMEAVGEAFFAAFPEHEVFNLPLENAQAGVELLVFPPLGRDELARLDNLLSYLVSRPPWEAERVFYRVVNDLRGERRELARPLQPSLWGGGEGLVGPFADEGEASAWGEANVDPRAGLVHDTLAYAGAWFCDVFRGE